MCTGGVALGVIAVLGAAVQALLAVRDAPQLQLSGGRLVGRQARVQQAVRQQLQAPRRDQADLHRMNGIIIRGPATIANCARAQCICDLRMLQVAKELDSLCMAPGIALRPNR